ncbi:glycosyltransferase family 2 protein [Mycobacterium hodleri]|uniref:Glycosyltransferase family 2 protein n=1 Tax=Mycolicibacterium hodleri TaxID=49897 RepID=A0A544VZF8_9MYCO|nr:glycosyltransferase family 2 protein [Mycolicibacterium hodleri]TQR85365.1 glycosyltransferase family 2 protein [Mycolicibacterium hodleri]
MAQLHVLTVHFNTPEMMSRLIENIPQQTPSGRAVYVHVLDNCSTVQNLSELRMSIEKLPAVTLEMNRVNVGFGAGINQLARSIRFGESDVLWIVNPDMRIEAGCIETLENELDKGHYNVVSPLIYTGDQNDRRIWYCGAHIDGHNLRVKHLLYGQQLADAPERPFETEFMTGAAPMMYEATFRAVGGFPEDYFLYWEDAFFSWKARELGFRLGVVPSARLWHAVGASSGLGQSRTFYYWYARNRFVFAHDFEIPRRRLLLGGGGLESVRIVGKALIERQGRLPKMRAAIRGSCHGLRRRRSS